MVKHEKSHLTLGCYRSMFAMGWASSLIFDDKKKRLVVRCFGLNGPLRQYFRGRKKRKMIGESKSVQTTSTHIFCKRSSPLPFYN